MRINIIFIVLFIAVVFLDTGFSAQGQLSNEKGYFLPWEKIAEVVEQGLFLCGDKDVLRIIDPLQTTTNYAVVKDQNSIYAYEPRQTVTINYEADAIRNNPFGENDIKIETVKNGEWLGITDKQLSIETNRILLPEGFENEGLYRFVIDATASKVEIQDFQAYFVVSSSWKKDILTFCREIKEEIELNPDEQLFRSTIAISHIDNVMELISESETLSQDILSALSISVKATKDFEAGSCPDFVKGLNRIRFKRFEGAEIAEFVFFIPDEYNDSDKWPLLLYPDPTRRGDDVNYTAGAGSTLSPFRTGLIEIWWHTSEVVKQYDWKDYQFFISILEEKLNIDKDKSYLFGWCVNAVTAMAVALQHPDQWAECGFVMSNSYRNLAGNALNLPLIYVKNFYEEGNMTGYFNFSVKCFLYYGCRDFQYNWEEIIPQFTGIKEPILSRKKSPQRVLYTINTLSNPKAYWVNIHGREDENLYGTIDACVWGQSVLVKTNNVDAYTLNLDQAPLDINRPIEIIENRQSIGFLRDPVFTNKSDKYENATFVKNAYLNGPVWDVFTDPYVIVWGSRSENSKLSAENEKAAKSLNHNGPCFPDSDFPADLIDNRNLVLVGTLESNSWLSKVAGKLPVHIESDQIIANGKKYDNSNIGLILVYPNPMNSDKYIAVFSGTSSEAIKQIPQAYSQMKSIRPADVGIFEVTDEGALKWHILEKFDTIWNWHNGWELSLANIEKLHPKWQWRQWFAKVLKQQMEVDVVVCEDPFLFKDSELIGQITYRDIFNSFRNDWIVKIEVNGTDLRKILTNPFDDISKREVEHLIIEGINLLNSVQDSNISTMRINDIESDKIYTIALPEKCLNGQRIGVELRDYQIVGDDYVVSLLRDYLLNNESVDIDAYLDSFKLKIF